MNITILNGRAENNVQCHAMLNARNAQHNRIQEPKGFYILQTITIAIAGIGSFLVLDTG